MLLLALLLALLAAPASAQAVTIAPFDEGGCALEAPRYGCNTTVSSLSYYKGWANVDDGYVCSGIDRGPDYYSSMSRPLPAWSWSNSYGWRSTTVARSTRVYVWPYATGWSWVWIDARGWLAMRDDVLVINQGHGRCMAP